MTKEAEEMPHKSNDNADIADQTVSTPTVSQTNCEKNITVESKANKNVNEANTNRKSEMSGNSGNDVQKNNLDNSEQKIGGVQNDISGIKYQNENKKTEEIEEEDVPGDFFDDFLKEDFMLGLDIVDDDAWEKELQADAPKSLPVANNVGTKNRKDKKKLTKSKSSTKADHKIDHAEKSRISLSGEKRRRQKKKKQEDREKPEDKEKHAKSKDKAIDADEFDIRRDPEKTKRDIEQYKAKCEKDKEKKIISEKLSLVETGLVPPGMEMEIDIEEVKRQKSKFEVGSRIEVQPPRDLRERLRKLRSKSKSPSHRQRSPKTITAIRRSASPLKKPSPKKRRTRSPGKISSRRSPARASPSKKSPHKKSPTTTSTGSQKRSPLRVRRSPLPFRSPSRRSRGRSFERRSPARRSRSHSPYYRSRRSRYSPFSRHRGRSDSRESDRERWLKRRRSRSRTPRRKREEKKSFLQEIAEKLNETRPQPIIMPPLQPQMHYVHPQSLPPVPSPVPAPTPVPPPTIPQFFPPRPQPPPQQQQFDPYDQNFFIGTPQPIRPPNFVGQPQNNSPVVGYPQQQIPLNPLSIKPINSPQLQNSSSAGSNMSRNMDRPKPPAQPHAQVQPPPHVQPQPHVQAQPRPQGQINIGIMGNKEDLTKLFQDKKITLSEFLAITAKPEVFSSSPANLQEKIKVIQRCHEAIKILGSAEKKYTGRLVVHRTDSYKVSKEAYLSPLMKHPPVTYPFTQPQIGNEQKASFTTFVNSLLKKIGLLKEIVVDVDKEVPSNPGIQPTPRALSPPPPPTITQNRNIVPTITQNRNIVPTISQNRNIVSNDMTRNIRSNKLTSNQLSKFIQTDVFKCENCEKRKKIVYKASAVQCGGESSNFSVGTQVTEEDFYKFQKTQSLASLTPAQLLARSGSNRTIDKDIFDKAPSQSNYPIRPNFMHPGEAAYNMPRYRSPSPPALHFAPLPREEILPSMYGPNSMRPPFIGGGGRGRDIPPNLPRTMDPRFGYNYY